MRVAQALWFAKAAQQRREPASSASPEIRAGLSTARKSPLGAERTMT